MTKSTATLLYVLGGIAILGGGGAAIYLATRKPGAVEGQGSTPNPDPFPHTTPRKPAIQISTTTEQLAQIANAAATLNLATALALANQPPDMGSAGGASL